MASSPPLLYATRSVLGSRQANAAQSAHMANALARRAGAICVYRSPSRYRTPEEDFSHYGLEAPATTHRIVTRWPAIEWLHFDLLSFCAALRQHPASCTVLTRNLSQCIVAVTLGYSTVLELHDPLTKARRALLTGLISTERLLGFIATTTRLRDDLRATFPRFPARRILVAGNAAKASNTSLPALPLARAPGSFHAAYAGSALKGKGVDVLLSCAQLRPTYTFHIIGPDAPLSAPHNTVWHGHVPQTRLIGLLKSMDALLLPNHPSVYIRTGLDIGSHTSPLKLFEYLSCGRPLVASDLPVFSGILTHGENALLAPSANPQAFCVQLDLLAGDSALRQRLSENAQCDFMLHHTWDHRARRILDFIASLGGLPA